MQGYGSGGIPVANNYSHNYEEPFTDYGTSGLTPQRGGGGGYGPEVPIGADGKAINMDEMNATADQAHKSGGTAVFNSATGQWGTYSTVSTSNVVGAIIFGLGPVIKNISLPSKSSERVFIRKLIY